MKNEFWKHKELIWATPLLITIIIGFVILSIIYKIWFLLAFFAVVILCILLKQIISKNFFAKIIITEEGIKWIFFKQQIMLIFWSEITDVFEKYRGKGNSWLWFVGDNKKIAITLTKDICETINKMCPYSYIKDKFNKVLGSKF